MIMTCKQLLILVQNLRDKSIKNYKLILINIHYKIYNCDCNNIKWGWRSKGVKFLCSTEIVIISK